MLRSILVAIHVVGLGMLTPIVQDQPAYTAIVLSSEARFVFPLPDQREWEWYRAATSDNAREYQWTAEVENGGVRYEFGFSLFKPPRQASGHGDLRALISAGQSSVAMAVDTGNGRWVLLGDAVHIAREGARLLVVVNDPSTLHRLFSERPPVATFHVRIPGAPDVTRSATITYGG